ncbi:MAG: nitrophenyl compound nitroreductase subunit ArsF family protein [Planctomycetota bacterium]
MKSAKVVISRVLIGFVLISIGFAIGRETARRGGGSPEGGVPIAAAATQPVGRCETGDDKVVVYYMHTTFRCLTCNRIESYTDSLIKSDFAAQLGDGRLEWKAVNFQENEAMAKRYGVGASCVVVVKRRDGREVGFKRLDEVWAKAGDPGEFTRYVSDAIRESLEGGGS